MATAKVIDKISDHVTCSLCLEKYKLPKSLPCQHTFCCECIATYIETQAERDGFYRRFTNPRFKCPVCRAETTLPSGGTLAFPTNFTLQSIAQDIAQDETLSRMASLDVNAQKSCFSCETNGTPDVHPVGICLDCDEKLCQECIDAHARVKVTRSHLIKPLSNATSKNPQKWFCEKHKHAEVTHFCMNDRTPLCYRCLVDIIGKDRNPHSGHTIHEVAKALEDKKEIFKAKFQKAERFRSKLLEQTKLVTDWQDKLSDSHEKTLSGILKVKTHVNQWALRMTEKADAFKMEEDEKIESTKQDLQIGIALLETGQEGIRDKIKEEGFRLLKTEETVGDIQVLLQDLLDTIEIDAASYRIPTLLNVSLDLGSGEAMSDKLDAFLGDVTCKAEYNKGCNCSAKSDDEQIHTAHVPQYLFDILTGQASVDEPRGSLNAVSANFRCSFTLFEDLGGIHFTPENDIFAVNRRTETVYHFSLTHDYRSLLEHHDNIGWGKLKDPWEVDQLPDGRLVVCDGKDGHSVKVFSKIGHYWRRTGNIAHSMLKNAVSVAASKDSHIVVSDLRGEGDDSTVYRINLQGGDKYEVGATIKHFYCDGEFRTQFSKPSHVACCSVTGKIAVSDNNCHCVKCFDANGNFLWYYGRYHGNEDMTNPQGLCFDSTGRLFVCDTGNKRIHIVSSQGQNMCHIPYSKLRMSPDPLLVRFTAKGEMAVANREGLVKIFTMRFG